MWFAIIFHKININITVKFLQNHFCYKIELLNGHRERKLIEIRKKGELVFLSFRKRRKHKEMKSKENFP